MREMFTGKNIFTLPNSPNNAVCITTNGIVKQNGENVMGAGVAKQAKELWSELPGILGKYIAQYGNRAFVLGTVNPYGVPYTLLSLPTKHDWKQDSDISLIYKSCEELMLIADKFGLETIYLTPPGCGNGNLNYEVTVQPWISMILDDRFCVVRR